MNPHRPNNHVTRALDAQRSPHAYTPVFPEVDEKLLKALEDAYPQRCKLPGEDLEAHAFYAGKANLVEQLRFEFDQRQASAVAEDPTDESDLPANAERVQL